MNHAIIAIFFYCLGVAMSAAFDQFRKNYKKRVARQETLKVIVREKKTTSAIALDAWSFVEEIRTAPSWGLMTSPVNGQLELVVSEGPGKMPQLFTGPRPLDMSTAAYRVFLDDVNRIAALRDDSGSRKF
jgi:hypothetical protein